MKNGNIVEKIIIKEDNDKSSINNSRKRNNYWQSSQKYLKLNNGIIIKDVSKEDLIIYFRKYNFWFKRFKTKTTVTPKIQKHQALLF